VRALGNKSLLPVFFYGSCSSQLSFNGGVKPEKDVDSVMVTIDGISVDVRKLKEQLEKSEKERIALEANLNALKNGLSMNSYLPPIVAASVFEKFLYFYLQLKLKIRSEN